MAVSGAFAYSWSMQLQYLDSLEQHYEYCLLPCVSSVQAMALQHGPGVTEVATNLIDIDWTTAHSSESNTSSSSTSAPSHTAAAAAAAAGAGVQPGRGAGPEQVMAAITAAAAQHGLPPPGPGYVTNKLPLELMEAARQAGLQ
jgi:hypothetical protein